MVMPRFLRNAVIPSDNLNAMAAELDNLGRACTVRRSSSGLITAGTDTLVTWNTEDLDTQGGGMFDPGAATYILCLVPGLYDAGAQVRCAPNGNSSDTSGRRSAFILVNSTNPASADLYNGPRAVDEQSPVASGSSITGVTLSMRTVIPLVAGDRVYVMMRSTHTTGGSVSVAQQDYGGTWLSLTRKAALS